MKIGVIDAQGGGLGKAIVEVIKTKLPEAEIYAFGTNSLATSAMLKAGAKKGATGENAIIYNADKMDFLVGGIGIIAANSMLGEITPNMATAISSCDTPKIIIPIKKCKFIVAGVENITMAELIERAISSINSH